MKQIYLLSTFFLLTFIPLNAQTLEDQTVILENACQGVNGTYTYAGMVKDRPSFEFEDWIFAWTGARWEHRRKDGTKIGMYSAVFTESVPPTSYAGWVGVECSPAGTVSGTGTSTVLGVNDFQIIPTAVKIYPNPTSNFVKVSGLTKTENYSIYNILGTTVRKGKISNNEKIDIQQLSNGIYLLQMEQGNTIKLIKE